MLIGALSPALTSGTAIGTLVVGILIAVGGPWLARRVVTANRPEPTSGVPPRWLLLGSTEVIAAILLFSSGHAFGIIPTLATPAKIGIVVLLALALSGAYGLLQRAFR